MLTQHRKELLLYGYVREQFEDITKIPNDIMKLFTDWFNDKFYIELSGDLIKEFSSTNVDDEMKDSYIIPIHKDISLKCKIIPSQSGKVRLNFQPISENKEILGFTIYLETKCEQIPTSMFREIKDFTNNNQHGFDTMSQMTALYSRCLKLDKLTFSVYVELVQIKKIQKQPVCEQNGHTDGDTNAQKEDPGPEMIYFVAPIWNKIIEYEWIIEGEKMEEFELYQVDEWLFSPIFADNSIGLHMTPKGVGYSATQTNLGIEFYRIPKDVHSVKMSLKIKTNIMMQSNNEIYESKISGRVFSCGSWASLPRLYGGDMRETAKQFGRLEFKIRLTVEKVWLYHNKALLDESEWKNYGILD